MEEESSLISISLQQQSQISCIQCKEQFNLQKNKPIKLECGHTLCFECCKQQKNQQKVVECLVDKTRYNLNLEQMLEKVDGITIAILYQNLQKEQILKEKLIQQIQQNMQIFKSKKIEILSKNQEATAIRNRIKEVSQEIQLSLELISNHFVKELLNQKKDYYFNKVKDLKSHQQYLEQALKSTQIILEYEKQQQNIQNFANIQEIQKIDNSLQNIIKFQQIQIQEENISILLKDNVSFLTIEEFINLILSQN